MKSKMGAPIVEEADEYEGGEEAIEAY